MHLFNFCFPKQYNNMQLISKWANVIKLLKKKPGKNNYTHPPSPPD